MDNSTNWCFTLNNYSEEEETQLRQAKEIKYLVYGKEKGELDTPHLQGYLILHKKSRLSGLKKLNARAHWETRKGTHEQARTYCIKDGDFVEIGIPPVTKKQQGELEKERWKKIKDLAKQNKLEEIEEIEPKLYVMHLKNLEHVAKKHMIKPQDISETTGLWIYGPSGIGKSKMARTEYPGAYFKQANKWWDGYQGEDNVIIDDLDKNHSVLGHHLKIWADHYSFIAEIKGGAIHIRPKLIIVTSQYSIEDIWTDQETQDALNRRFKKINMLDQFVTNKN